MNRHPQLKICRAHNSPMRDGELAAWCRDVVAADYNHCEPVALVWSEHGALFTVEETADGWQYTVKRWLAESEALVVESVAQLEDAIVEVQNFRDMGVQQMAQRLWDVLANKETR